MTDILDITANQIQDSIVENLLAGERHRKNCYKKDREQQLIRFNIGYTPDWSQAELIAALDRRIKSLRRGAKLNPGMAATLLLPMLRAARLVEIERAQEEAA